MFDLELVTSAFAQASGAAPRGGAFMGLMPLVLMFVVFYFLLIRPQQKRAKEHQSMLDALERGDEIVTQGGLHGTVVGLTEQVVTIEIAELDKKARLRVKVDRSAVSRRQTKESRDS